MSRQKAALFHHFTYVFLSSKSQFKCEYLDSFVSKLYGQFKVDIGYVSGTTYKNQNLGINNMLNSLKRRKVNPLLKKFYVLFNFIGISFSVLRAIVKNACYKNISWAHFVIHSKKN